MTGVTYACFLPNIFDVLGNERFNSFRQSSGSKPVKSNLDVSAIVPSPSNKYEISLFRNTNLSPNLDGRGPHHNSEK